MNTKLLDDIGAWLTAQNVVGGTTGWTLYKGFLPPDPDPPDPTLDQLVCIFETPGGQADIIRDFSNGEKPFDTPGIQVRIRGTVDGYAALQAQADVVFNALHQNEPPKTATQNYVYIYLKNGNLPMGKDSSNRDTIIQNYSIMRQR